jgi:hypothetical protein
MFPQDSQDQKAQDRITYDILKCMALSKGLNIMKNHTLDLQTYTVYIPKEAGKLEVIGYGSLESISKKIIDYNAVQ